MTRLFRTCGGKNLNYIKNSLVNAIDYHKGIVNGILIASRRNFFNSTVFLKAPDIESYGSYTKGPDVSDVLKMALNHPVDTFKKGWRIFSEECKLFREEMKFKLSDEIKIVEKGKIDMLFTFDHENCLDKWILSTDKMNNQGFSTANFITTNSETALLSGYLDTTLPEDGVTNYTGYVNIQTKRLLKSFRRFTTYDWSEYTHLVLKVRGDGRTYVVILGCPGDLNVSWHDQFHYPLYTRGGPYWQIVKIPFSNFYFTNKGKVQDEQFIMQSHCSRVGISLIDKITGPFKLEIEYIGLEYNPYHKAICPYEMYKVGRNVAE